MYTALVRCCAPRLLGGRCCQGLTLLSLIECSVVRVAVACFIPSDLVLFKVLDVPCACFPSFLIIVFAFRALVDCNSFKWIARHD
jgi:hypothetical protein